jgi:glutamate-1-semialdehyde 2,1-aminomutase
MVQAGWSAAASGAGLPITVSGLPALSHFTINLENAQAVRTLFTQMMLERGFLATNAFYAMYAHTEQHVEKYLTAVGEVFQQLATAVDRNEVERLLRGPVAHSGFHRLT